MSLNRRKDCPNRATLSLFAAGVLEADLRRDMEAHLQECSCCKEDARELALLTKALEAQPKREVVDPPATLRQRWTREVRKATEPSRALLLWQWLNGPRLAWSSVAATWLLILFFRMAPPDISAPSAAPIPARPISLRAGLVALQMDPTGKHFAPVRDAITTIRKKKGQSMGTDSDRGACRATAKGFV